MSLGGIKSCLVKVHFEVPCCLKEWSVPDEWSGVSQEASSKYLEQLNGNSGN